MKLGTIFQLKLTNLIFWAKFVQKRCFRSKTEKMNSAIEFCIEFPVENGKIVLLRASMVVTYYIKLFNTVDDRHSGILMSLLLLVAEKMKKRKQAGP